MEYRQLGRSGLKISVLAMGTMTMGGKGNFAKVGNVGLDEARRHIVFAWMPASISSTSTSSKIPSFANHIAPRSMSETSFRRVR